MDLRTENEKNFSEEFERELSLTNSIVEDLLKVDTYNEFFVLEKKWNIQLNILSRHYDNMLKNFVIAINNKRTKFKGECETIIQEIKEKIEEYHNPSLILNDESPNNNTIYKLYEDFSITHEKGGWAYGQRTQFLVECPLLYDTKLGIEFPMKETGEKSYAIMEYKHCIELYDKYKAYLKLI